MNLLPNFSTVSQYERIGAFSLRDGLIRINKAFTQGEREQVAFGVVANFAGNRVGTYLYKGIRCAHCGILGSYFAIERSRHQRTDKYHVNLWAINHRGHHILMTSDHIMPRSKGGRDSIENRQPMCCRCNSRKADLTPDQLANRERNKALGKTYEGIMQIRKEKEDKSKEKVENQNEATI